MDKFDECMSVDKLLRKAFPVEQGLAEADGVSNPAVEAAWREIRRRLDEHWRLTHGQV